jgi:AraC family transcriptional regulator
MIKAASLLEHGASVAEAGVAVGYHSPSAFIKGFKRVFGTLPARRLGSPPLLIPRITAPTSLVCRELQPEIRTLPQLPLLYVTKKGIMEEFFDGAQAYDVLDNCLREMAFKDKVLFRLGILRNTTHPDTRQWRFDACVVPDSTVTTQLPAPVQRGTIQAGQWAVFSHIGAYDTLWQTWSLAYKVWLPNSAMQLRDVPPFEVYLSDKHTTSPEKLKTEIHLPVSFK